MPREIALADALVPGLLLIYLGCLLVLWLIDTLIGRYGLYRYVWHPSLFRVAVFFLLFGAAGLLLYP
jgi:steroid 5-alpha reductase family enzyme